MHFRVVSLFIAATVLIGTGYFLEQVLTIGRHHQTLAVHYNVYVGIDDVRSWQWSLFLPLGWLVVTAINLFCSYIFYRRDPQVALSLLLFSGLTCIPWMAFLFYLTVLNR